MVLPPHSPPIPYAPDSVDRPGRPSHGAVSGTVRAEGTQEPVAYAVMRIPALERRVVADARGYFVLSGLRGTGARMEVTALGYRPWSRDVSWAADAEVRIEVVLTREPVGLAPVVARARRGDAVAAQAGPGTVRLDPALMAGVPAMAERDVFRAVQTLPSVTAASDFSSALYVRGGAPDQTLIRLDGVPLFNPYHLGGLFAAVDPDATASVDLLAGVQPASDGDRLAGIVDLRTREGARDSVHASGSIGLISARAGANGPLPGRRGSYLVAARRTYLDLFTAGLAKLGTIPYSLPYGFTDALLKMDQDVGARGSVGASLYLDGERLRIPPELRTSDLADWRWGSRAALLRGRYAFGRSVLLEALVASTSFSGDFFLMRRTFPDTLPRTDVAAATSMGDRLARIDLRWYAPRHQVRAGAQFDTYRFDYRIDNRRPDLDSYLPDLSLRRTLATMSVWAEDEWNPSDVLTLRGGLRALRSSAGTTWMPRLTATYALSAELSASAGVGRQAQPVSTVRAEESAIASVMAYDLLGPTPLPGGMATATQIGVGVQWARRGIELRGDLYRRTSRLPIVPPPGDPLRGPLLVPGDALAGRGTATGLELLGRWALPRGMLSLSYALTRTRLSVGGEEFTPRYHRTHRLDATGLARLGKTGQIGLRAVLASGQPYTPLLGEMPTWRYDPAAGGLVPDGGPAVLGPHNSARLPAYFRLDLSARNSRTVNIAGRVTTLSPYLQVLNVLNTKNALLAETERTGTQDQPSIELAPQLPILPTIGVEWAF